MLKIKATEREKIIKRLTATSNSGGEYQNWQFIKTRSRLSKHHLWIQTNNRFLLLKKWIEDWNEA